MSSAVLSKVAALLCGATMLGLGLWALFWPVSFAAWVDFPPYNEHLLHDVGAFQIGIGVTLLLAAVVRDALTVALAGFVCAGSIHAVVHRTDLHLGGHHYDAWGLAGLVVVAGVGLVARAADQRRTSGPALMDKSTVSH